MILNYRPERLEALSKDFFIATGVKLGICDANLRLLNYDMKVGNKYCSLLQTKDSAKLACRRSDRALLERCKAEGRVVMHTCHAGFLDLALPIVYEKKIIAYLILGQIKIKEDCYTFKEKALFSEEERAMLEKYYKECPLIEREKIESIANVAMMMVKHILFENMIIPKYEPVLDRAISFINDNIEKNLTISEISKSTLIPKSSLYKMFHSHLGCTVSEYVNLKRIDKATDLLITTTMSVAEISEKLGFSTPQYFSKTFNKLKGVSPAKYRKLNQ